MSEHTMRVAIEDGGLHFRLTCHNDPADTSRLCWPLQMTGEPEEAPAGCVYVSWADNLCPDEWHSGCVTIDCDAEFRWEGDAPSVTLSNPRELARAGSQNNQGDERT